MDKHDHYVNEKARKMVEEFKNGPDYLFLVKSIEKLSDVSQGKKMNSEYSIRYLENFLFRQFKYKIMQHDGKRLFIKKRN
ncbi:hypothetical protein CVD25_08215 [Bacillus canaveralius]|uniref:Uncharacterized protein n=1 Tax=Bacillus canaveralius TaxID=1403243 RepID=A0A2N5GIG5_9BACI|nr:MULTISPECIES: hypothetical protein [Bacillus]PLR80779.1 hypothetical protein CU635_17155 [Bacillus canaveralius]PLR84316.1 hypothetical protein CVD23_12190 [Bacillus sp. V33-4]PLR98343.1 hypothetical protein CVD25_08215 [Bacillus canaveralius]RSK52936.1 hypothetical protein EJA13_09750 [Bacillus canaveralius]